MLTNLHPSRQRGVALVMALVFLSLLTILGVTAMSTSSLEEKMAANTRDRNLGFQAAETALWAAETYVAGLASDAAPWADSTKGRYDPSATSNPNWDSVNWSSSSVVSYPCTPDDATPNVSSSCLSGGRSLLTKVATQPKYIVERMGPTSAANIIMYRITARGTGGTDAARVMLQSTFERTY